FCLIQGPSRCFNDLSHQVICKPGGALRFAASRSRLGPGNLCRKNESNETRKTKSYCNVSLRFEFVSKQKQNSPNPPERMF
ncbi:MAG: hypothetical protein WBE74_18270, partial [Terracidiphilus sp.]